MYQTVVPKSINYAYILHSIHIIIINEIKYSKVNGVQQLAYGWNGKLKNSK